MIKEDLYMDNDSRKDIRRILKTFGIQADEALVAHLARNPDLASLRVRITLEDMTDYGMSPPESKLALVIEDEINC
jgi:hypothetical protein